MTNDAIVLVVLCAVALLVVAWRVILPLAVLHFGGAGVEFPLPKRLVMAHPKLAIYLFVIGGSVLFLALVVAFIWLLRLRMIGSGS